MIIVIVQTERNPKTGRLEKIVYHGVNENGETIIMPNEPPDVVGAVYDPDIGEYVIRDKE